MFLLTGEVIPPSSFAEARQRRSQMQLFVMSYSVWTATFLAFV